MKIRGFYPEGIYYVKDPLGRPVAVARGVTFGLKPEKVIDEGI